MAVISTQDVIAGREGEAPAEPKPDAGHSDRRELRPPCSVQDRRAV